MMTQPREHLQGRGKVQTLSRARIQPMGHGVQLMLSVIRQVRPLGQILSQQAIGILVGPALPGAVRMGKEDPDREPLGQALMFRPLFAPIVGQRLAQRGRDVAEFFREARCISSLNESPKRFTSHEKKASPTASLVARK
jgi:hypothetical protein